MLGLKRTSLSASLTSGLSSVCVDFRVLLLFQLLLLLLWLLMMVVDDGSRPLWIEPWFTGGSGRLARAVAPEVLP